jgi:hypothetical protein
VTAIATIAKGYDAMYYIAQVGEQAQRGGEYYTSAVAQGELPGIWLGRAVPGPELQLRLADDMCFHGSSHNPASSPLSAGAGAGGSGGRSHAFSSISAPASMARRLPNRIRSSRLLKGCPRRGGSPPTRAPTGRRRRCVPSA